MDKEFTVLPMSQRISLKAGEQYEGSIKVVNPADATKDFAYKVSVNPYGVADNTYDADFITDTNRTAISKWITIEEPTGTIKPNESKVIKFKINVPENAPGGGQYAALAVSSNQDATPSDGLAVNNVLEMASIIYASVAGETVHKGEILENNIPGFTTEVPARVSALIKNEGNIHEDATFVITVSDFFSGNKILPAEEDEGQYTELIMPETTRYIEREIDNLPALGVVKVKQTIYYNGVMNEAEKEIIICPIWFLALLTATLVAIIFTVVQIIRKHRKKGQAPVI